MGSKATWTSKVRGSKYLLPSMIALALLVVPALAFAIPGAGDFTAVHSPSGRDMTELYNILAKICLGILILVEGVLLVAIVKFRRRSDDERPAQVHGHLPLEIGWTLAAAVLQVYIGVKTIDVMFEVEVMPETTMTVEAIGYQWGWQFRYPDHGGMLTDDLVVPAHTNVKLEITSRDVIHSIFIPELGVKMDAVPGRFNYWWFNADGPVNQILPEDQNRVKVERETYKQTRPDFVADIYDLFTGKDSYENPETVVTGLENRVTYMAQSRPIEEVSPYAKYDAIEYRGMCTEICGKGHYNMYFRTVAMTQSSFDQWLKDQAEGSGEVDGGAIYTSKCASCHAADGNGVEGQFPPLVGTPWVVDPERKADHIEVVLKGSQAASLMGDTEVNGVVYTGVMQPWAEALNDAEVAAVVNHERTSWGNDGGEVTPEDVAALRADLGLPPFPAGGSDPIPMATLMTEGKRVYEACATCHGNDGRGLESVPNLAGNKLVLENGAEFVKLMELGTPKHSPMGKTMTDLQLTSLLAYVRNSWGNEATPATIDEVVRFRNEAK